MKLKRLLWFLGIIILLGVLSVYLPRLTGKSVVDSAVEYPRKIVLITRVIDGDTVQDYTGQSYRLLGLNTPEKKKPYYQEAKDFLIMEIENKTVELLRDKEDVDKYKRKLRYVFYEGRLINVEILEKGLATSFMLEDLKYKDKFANAEKFAEQNELGLWKRGSNKCADCIKLLELNYKEEFFIIKNSCGFDCDLNEWEVKDDANHFFILSDLRGGEERKYDSKIDVWNNDGDRFFMRDGEGGLVVFYEY